MMSLKWFETPMSRKINSFQLVNSAQGKISVNTFELCYNVITGAEYFVSLQTSVVLTEEYTVMVYSEVLIATRYLALQTGCRIN
jgi:hypothetical protein